MWEPGLPAQLCNCVLSGACCAPCVPSAEQGSDSLPPLHRFGSLYGELARFILRLLGFKAGKRKLAAGKGGGQEGGGPPGELMGPAGAPPGMLLPPPAGGGPLELAGPVGAHGGDSWNSLW